MSRWAAAGWLAIVSCGGRGRWLFSLWFVMVLMCCSTDDPEDPAAPEPGQASRCEDPEPIMQLDGTPSGFERCADGFVHRAAAVECAESPPGDCDASQLDPVGSTCSTDADCGMRGRCMHQLTDPNEYYCGCKDGGPIPIHSSYVISMFHVGAGLSFDVL